METTFSVPHTIQERDTIKDGEHNDPKKYRPISLLSHTRKIVESAIDIILKKLYSNNPLQLGLQPGKSTETAILRATEL